MKIFPRAGPTRTQNSPGPGRLGPKILPARPGDFKHWTTLLMTTLLTTYRMFSPENPKKALTSELTTRQNAEINSFENQLAEIEDEALLKEVLKLIKRANNEFLSRNITCVIFYPKFTAAEGELIAHEWIKLAKESMRNSLNKYKNLYRIIK